MTSRTSLRIGDAILGGTVLTLGVFILVETYRTPFTGRGVVDPQFFPYAIGGGLVLVGLSLLREMLGPRRDPQDPLQIDWLPVAFIAAGLLVQGFLLASLGWIVATLPLFLAVSLAFRERRLLLSALIGGVLASLVFVVFTHGLGLDLPVGRLFEPILNSGG